jgi:phosphoribosylamine--glycine ligase
MGGYARPSYASTSLLEEIEQRILRPTLAGMAAEGQPYRGVLYAGLMLTRAGPMVIEFNCRFGDPECQLVLPLLASSLSETCAAVAGGELHPSEVRWTAGRTFGVVLAARGYPEAPQLGEPISGLDNLPDGVLAFHAGTSVDANGRLVNSGGRVLTVVGSDCDAVYTASETIRFEGKQYRHDIGRDEARALAGVAAGSGGAP